MDRTSGTPDDKLRVAAKAYLLSSETPCNAKHVFHNSANNEVFTKLFTIANWNQSSFNDTLKSLHFEHFEHLKQKKTTLRSWRVQPFDTPSCVQVIGRWIHSDRYFYSWTVNVVAQTNANRTVKAISFVLFFNNWVGSVITLLTYILQFSCLIWNVKLLFCYINFYVPFWLWNLFIQMYFNKRQSGFFK